MSLGTVKTVKPHFQTFGNLILVHNLLCQLQPTTTTTASRGISATARLSCINILTDCMCMLVCFIVAFCQLLLNEFVYTRTNTHTPYTRSPYRWKT